MTKKKEPEAPAAALPVTYTRSEQIVRRIVDAGVISVGAKILESVEREASRNALKRSRPQVTIGVKVKGAGEFERNGQRTGDGLFERYFTADRSNRDKIAEELRSLASAIEHSTINMRGAATILLVYNAGGEEEEDA